MTVAHYDAVIVGAGAGGGVMAWSLAQAGKSVLLLERGRGLTFQNTGRDHLRNQRLALYGHNAGPDDTHVRTMETRGNCLTVLPWQGGYSNNAAGVGSGTAVYGAQAWRFHPLDFKMASTYGVPDGSSLADWPLTYEELAPFYALVENELGVAGDDTQMTHLPAYTSPYPLPPMVVNRQGETLRTAARGLGWDTLSIPLAINTVPRDGRAACIHCQHCVGFMCPTDAKNGTQNTYIPRALATGNCTLLTGAMATRIMTDAAGTHATGVTYHSLNTGEDHEIAADVVVVAGGAVETARLLLLSRLGGPHVGRHLQGHYYPGATSLLDHDIWDGIGPGATTATCRWNHGNPDIIGGGMLADDFIPLPLSYWKGYLPPDVPRWGMAAKDWMIKNHRRTLRVMGPTQDIPTPDARVTLDPDVTDAYQIPVAHLSGLAHPETVRTATFMHGKAREWLLAAGAVKVWGDPPGPMLSAGQHQAGTARMGNDPAQSVTDRNCRVHTVDNLYIGDTSVHVTNGGYNPFLTAMALARRTGAYLLERW